MGSPLWRWLRALAPVALYALAIVLVSSQSDLPKTRVWDKAAHFVEYTILGFLICRALWLLRPMGPGKAMGIAVALSTAFGLTDEIHQYFVPRRDASLGDLVADFLGSVAGVVVWYGWFRLAKRLGRRESDG